MIRENGTESERNSIDTFIIMSMLPKVHQMCCKQFLSVSCSVLHIDHIQIKYVYVSLHHFIQLFRSITLILKLYSFYHFLFSFFFFSSAFYIWMWYIYILTLTWKIACVCFCLSDFLLKIFVFLVVCSSCSNLSLVSVTRRIEK